MGKQLNLEQSDAPARRHHRGSRRFCRAPTVQVVRSRWATSASLGRGLVLELRAERRGTVKRCGHEKRLTTCCSRFQLLLAQQAPVLELRAERPCVGLGGPHPATCGPHAALLRAEGTRIVGRGKLCIERAGGDFLFKTAMYLPADRRVDNHLHLSHVEHGCGRALAAATGLHVLRNPSRPVFHCPQIGC